LTWDLDEELAIAQRADDARERACHEGPEAFGGWLERSLGFQRDGPNVFHYVHLEVGYQPRGVPLPKEPTLLPRDEAISLFGAFEVKDPGKRSDETAFGPFTFSSDEVDQRTTLLRVGHPFVAAVERMIEADVRGRAWVLWRHVPTATVGARLYFCFQFALETDVAPVRAAYGTLTPDESALRRMGDQALAPEHATVWVSAAGQVEVREAIVAILARPYRAVEHGGSDTNVRGDGWLTVGEHIPLVDWAERCAAARQAAERWLRSRPEFHARCAAGAGRIQADAAVRGQRSRARLLRLHGPAHKAEASALELESAIAAGLAKGALAPTARVDVAGAVVLSSIRMGRA
jgi:hypothetical protein